jgi:hypothetical protein
MRARETDRARVALRPTGRTAVGRPKAASPLGAPIDWIAHAPYQPDAVGRRPSPAPPSGGLCPPTVAGGEGASDQPAPQGEQPGEPEEAHPCENRARLDAVPVNQLGIVKLLVPGPDGNRGRRRTRARPI